MTPGWIPDRQTKCQQQVRKSPEFLSKITFDYRRNSLRSPRRHPLMSKQSPKPFRKCFKIVKHNQYMSHQCRTNVPNIIKHVKRFANTVQVSMDHSWILHWYLRLFMGKLKSSSSVFCGCLQQFFSEERRLFIITTTIPNNHETKKNARRK